MGFVLHSLFIISLIIVIIIVIIVSIIIVFFFSKYKFFKGTFSCTYCDVLIVVARTRQEYVGISFCNLIFEIFVVVEIQVG